MGKRIPQFKTDQEAEKFLEQDLTDYIDPKYLIPLRFEFKPKDAQVNLRLAKGLLQAIKARAAAEGISYQKFIRMALEQTISRSGKDSSNSEGEMEK
jgi:predicted DNA binding CopG/RHH family protein